MVWSNGVGFTYNDVIGFQYTGATLHTQINAAAANNGIQSRLNRFTEVANNCNGSMYGAYMVDH